MSFNKIHTSERVTKIFPLLKSRTGLTPNIICRIALCLSISDPSPPNTRLEDEKGQEFSRYTLLGEWDSFFISILRERLIHDKLDPEKDLMPQFKAHINRGVLAFTARVKDLSDICDLLPNNPNNESFKEIRKEKKKNSSKKTSRRK